MRNRSPDTPGPAGTTYKLSHWLIAKATGGNCCSLIGRLQANCVKHAARAPIACSADMSTQCEGLKERRRFSVPLPIFATMSNERSERGVPVFVMLPLDTVDPSSRQLKRRSTLRLQLEKLREAGVEGVMVDVWWGLVERKPREYEWGAYMQLVQLLEELQLKAQCVMSFHACGGNVGDDCNIPLPPWVARSAAIAASANDDEAHALPFYKDRDGHVSYEYVSCAANEQPVLSGRYAARRAPRRRTFPRGPRHLACPPAPNPRSR